MKLWHALILGLLMVILPLVGACLADKPLYSSDEVIEIVQQQLDFFDMTSPIQRDRYGARLLGKAVVTNFKLDEWDAKYFGDGIWRVSAQTRYRDDLTIETGECIWYFDETSDTIEFIRIRG